jgi:hypothetical protein
VWRKWKKAHLLQYFVTIQQYREGGSRRRRKKEKEKGGVIKDECKV